MTLIVITGATAGIGFESARQMARQGHDLVLVGRSPEKLKAASARVLAAGAGKADTVLADLASFESVRAAAAEIRERFGPIDVLVNNAGLVNDVRRETGDGVESTFAVNHLAGFLLTELLKDRVADGGRIVFTSSVAHYGGTMDFDDLGYERGYRIMKAYARSKLANVMYTRSLAVELADRQVTVNALHPGTIRTDIWAGAPTWAKPILAVNKLFMRSPAKGGEAITYLATSPEVTGLTGGYYENDKAKEPSALALDDAVGERLREESARLVGLENAG